MVINITPGGKIGAFLTIVKTKHSLNQHVNTVNVYRYRLPRYACQFIEMCLMVTADHGPAVSGAHNTIVCARAGKDLISSLTSGLLTIVRPPATLLLHALSGFTCTHANTHTLSQKVRGLSLACGCYMTAGSTLGCFLGRPVRRCPRCRSQAVQQGVWWWHVAHGVCQQDEEGREADHGNRTPGQVGK